MPRKPKKGVTGRPTAVLRMSGFPITDGSQHIPIVVAADGSKYELVGVTGGECVINCHPLSSRPAWVRMSVESLYRYPSAPKPKPPKKKASKRTKKGR